MHKNIGIAIFLIVSSFVPFLAAASSGLLHEVSQKYRDAQLVEMNVEKSVKSELMGKETRYSGKIYLAQGKFRWENTTPEKTLLVFDGKMIWSEQTPPKEIGGPVQVAKGKVDKRTKSHILISSLLGASLDKNFKVLKTEKNGEMLRLNIAPLTDDLTINSLQILVSSKDKALHEISYKDDIGNLTTMTFKNIQFLKKEKKNLFKYQPPKNASVTDL